MGSENIHVKINLKLELARTYAEDGAFHSAARTLRELADDLERHARAIDSQMDRELGDPKSTEKKGGA